MRSTSTMLAVAFTLVALLGVSVGCEDELPESPLRTVSGTIHYEGADLAAMQAPVVEIALFADFPPTGLPHAAATLEAHFEDGAIPFVLEHLDSYEYYLVVQVAEASGERTGPAGAYPDFCSLSDATGGLQIGESDVEGLEVWIYDQGGAADPCGQPSGDFCPEEGSATLVLTLDAPELADRRGSDNLILGAFPEWPPTGMPTWFATEPASVMEFPQETISTNLPPGEHIVYACYDRRGDNLMGVCGDEDAWALVNDGESVSFSEGEVVTVELDLISGATASLSRQNAADAGCP